MSESIRSAAKLFNNLALSDVKIKQAYEGQTREYYAHNAVLCLESEYFLNAFTGSFREASESTLGPQDDNPEHFEFLLKFIYTGAYDKEEAARLADNDQNKRVPFAIGVHAVAHKYGVAKICEPAVEDAKAILLEATSDLDMLTRAIQANYGTEIKADRFMGRLITTVVFEKYDDFLGTKDFEYLLLAQPVFAADVALYAQRSERLKMQNLAYCPRCQTRVVDLDAMRKIDSKGFFCPGCVGYTALPISGT